MTRCDETSLKGPFTAFLRWVCLYAPPLRNAVPPGTAFPGRQGCFPEYFQLIDGLLRRNSALDAHSAYRGQKDGATVKKLKVWLTDFGFLHGQNTRAKAEHERLATDAARVPPRMGRPSPQARLRSFWGICPAVPLPTRGRDGRNKIIF